MSLASCPYGSWDSPISTDLITLKATKIESVLVDPITSKIYLLESRPDEAGRTVIVDIQTGRDVFGKGFNARSTVQEYGGAAAAVYGDVVYFSNMSDRGLYKLDTTSGSEPVKVCPGNDNWRYGDFVVHPIHPHLLVSILEDHAHDEPSLVVTSLVVLNIKTSTVTPLVQGADFFSSPSISPDGAKIAFERWFHPDMPWDGSELILHDLAVTSNAATLEIQGESILIAGKRAGYSAQQPTWAGDDALLYLSSETGFFNPYIYSPASGKSRAVFKDPLAEDFGEPGWLLGQSTYALLGGESGIFTSVREGRNQLYQVNFRDGTITDLQSPYAEISCLHRVSEDVVVFHGKKFDESAALVEFNLKTAAYKVLRRTSQAAVTLPAGIFAPPRPLSLPIPETKGEVYVIFYPPTNPAYAAPGDELPPAIVGVHGGPTGRTPMGLDLSKQYFTSRGFAWVDVNYGGSSGFGAPYINRLKGNWGIVDVDDCAVAVDALGERGLIDRKRVAIRGGSAGGYTVLASVVNKPTFYAAGTSLYGVSDLKLLAEFTHKFESRYLDGLIGGTVEEVPDLYKERSPITHASNIRSPLLILQGSDDKVVPPNQAKTIVKAIESNGGVVKYIEFAGEGHGWRQAKHIREGLEAELAWYRQVLNIK